MERLVLVLVFGDDDLPVLVPLFRHGVLSWGDNVSRGAKGYNSKKRALQLGIGTKLVRLLESGMEMERSIRAKVENEVEEEQKEWQWRVGKGYYRDNYTRLSHGTLGSLV